MIPAEEKSEQQETAPKPVIWIASSRKDLRAFPKDVKDVVGFALYQASNGREENEHAKQQNSKKSRQSKDE